MNVRNVMTFAAIMAALLLLAQALRQQNAQVTGTRSVNAPGSPIPSMVADTLHQHEGEESTFVHAFEEALEHRAG